MTRRLARRRKHLRQLFKAVALSTVPNYGYRSWHVRNAVIGKKNA